MKKIYLSLFVLAVGLFGSNNLFSQSASFGYTGGMQYWTVPAGVTSVTMDVYGAQGGNTPWYVGGYGARVYGTVAVTPGQQLKILVGGQGGYGYNGGGGGGSFVTDPSNNPLMIAGGGGGGAYSGYDHGWRDAVAGTSAQGGVCGGCGQTQTSAGGTGGNGGGGPWNYCNSGSSGGGLYSDGTGTCDNGAGYAISTGGRAFVNGGAGGVAASNGTPAGAGGFGGGGGADWNYWTGGGGGGGYSGGGGGAYYGVGGGGGSYNGGSSPQSWGAWQGGNGYVSFTYTSCVQGDPAVWGSNVWNAYVWNAGDAGGGSGAWSSNYSGYYVISNLSFDTRTGQTYSTAQSWDPNGAPSSASGYSGCAVGVDNHSYAFKRQGFPCAKYQINIPNHDDICYLYVNGAQVFVHNGCCDSHTNVWTGWLTSSSTVEYRISEGGGGSHGSLEFIDVTPAVISNMTLNGTAGDITVNSCSPTVNVAQSLGSTSDQTTYYYWGTENPPGSRWVTVWDLCANCNINVGSFSTNMPGTPGRYVMHTNAYNVCGTYTSFGGTTYIVTVVNPTPPSLPASASSAGITSYTADGYITTGKKNGWYSGGSAVTGNGTGCSGAPDLEDMGNSGVNGAGIGIPGHGGSYSGITYTYTTNGTPGCGGSYYVLDASTFGSVKPALGCSGRFNANDANNPYAPVDCPTQPAYNSGVGGTVLQFTGSTYAAYFNAAGSGTPSPEVQTRFKITTSTGTWQQSGSKYYLKIPANTTFTINALVETYVDGSHWGDGMLTNNLEQANCPYATCNTLGGQNGNWVGFNYMFHSQHSLNSGYVTQAEWGRVYNAFNPIFTTDLETLSPLTGTQTVTCGGTTQFSSDRITMITSGKNYTVPSGFNGNAQVLVVGGGGGGGTNIGGGGGGGGVIYTTYPVTSGQVINVNVGAGGGGAPAGTGGGHPSMRGFNGGNSVFGYLTAYGGGAGGVSYNTMGLGINAGAAGGCGGGATGYNNDSEAPGTVTGGAGTAGQGYNGGNQGDPYYSGGGGGAGGPGVSGDSRADGGPGFQCAITGTNYYWGGGGGGAGHSTDGGYGGLGGGGGGASWNSNYGLAGGGGITTGTNGIGGGYAAGGDGGANTGGGGGAGSHYNSGNKGGDGGSGIVIVRCQDLLSGSWSSNNTGIATVNGSGLVTGVSPGTTTINYSVTYNGCATQTVSRTVTVSAAPVGPLTGSQIVACGSATKFIPDAPAGGTSVTSVGGYRIHTFTSGTNNFVVPAGFTGNVEVMVVGGGGGGGSDMGGGGGAGGFIYTPYAVTGGDVIPVTVGAGGTGAPPGVGQVRGSNGGNSVFGSLTAIGGGGGASDHYQSINPAGNGGSGGGASGGAQPPYGGSGGSGGYGGGAAGTGTVGQGNNGSFGVWAWYPGGGGGAGGPGSTNPAHGGVGIQCAINGTNYYWAGGGGGAGYSNIAGNGGAGGGGGGSGGGGSGSSGGSGINSGANGTPGCAGCWADVPGGNAGANTGGGGGGGSHYDANNNGGNGGSGIVIVRYPEGSWSSSNSGIASVNSSGVVTGVSPGTATITYQVGSGSCANAVTRTVTVTLPAVAPLTGNQTICAGSTSTFVSDAPTGGNTVASVGGYRIHTFTSGTQNFTTPAGFNGNVEVLVVAGGGGGASGGGGAGGVVSSNFAVTGGNAYSVVVGDGGNGGQANGGAGRTNGNNSQFSTLVAIGGGAGGQNDNLNAASSGGSGGGGGSTSTTVTNGGAGTATQGYYGGTVPTSFWGNPYPSSGGGGAGSWGNSPTNSSTSGNGGAGLPFNTSGSTVYYGGGGGGGTWNNGTHGTGGIGGGGAGGYPNGTAGTANTGGGGGGGCGGGGGTGGAGGSGIVIVRYTDVTAGTWSSSNNAIATVNSSGVVTGVSGGTTNINYTISSGSCSNTVSRSVTVTGIPAPQVAGNVTVGPVNSLGGAPLLPDANMTASSNCCGNHEAWKGRLFNPGWGSVQCWASANPTNFGNEYLQIDLGSVKPVNGIYTQGRGDCCPQWVTSYTVQVSNNGSTWSAVGGTYTGNSDQQTVVTNLFATPVNARYVRIIPQGMSGHMSMRADVISIPCGISQAVNASAELPTCASGIRWYDSPSGGTLLATGMYLTQTISANKTIYAEAYNGSAVSSRTAVLLQVNKIPTPTVGVTNVTCYGSNNGVVSVNVTGGTPPYSYAWSSGQTTQVVSSLAPSAYTVTVSSLACTASASGTVTQPSIISITPTPTNEGCAGSCNGAVSISVSGGTPSAKQPNSISGLVAWANGDNGVLRNISDQVFQWSDISGSGNNFAQASSGNSPSWASGIINSKPVIRFSSSQFMTTATNFGNPYTIFAISKMNGPNYGRLISSASTNYLLGNWSGQQNDMYANGWVNGPSGIGADNATHMWAATGNGGLTTFYDFANAINSNANGVSPPGQLQLNGYSNGLNEMSDADVAEVIVYNRVLSATEIQGISNYLAAKYAIAGSGGTPYTFNWSNSATTQNITSLCAATYTVTVTDANLCTATVSSVVGTTTPTVGVPAAPTPASSTICQGSSNTTYTTTGATNATSYNWTVTGSGNTIAGTGTTGTVTWAAGFSGTATVSVTANGCNGPSAPATATVTVTPTVGVPAAPTPASSTICQGSSNTTYTTTGATNATSYNWTVTGSGNTIAGTGTTGTVTWAAGFSGTATVSVTANGCNSPSAPATATVTVTPTVGVPAAPTPASSTICQGSPNTTYTTTGATNATSYTWTVTGSGNTIAGTGTTGTVTWAAGFSGTATVSVTANGCNGPSAPASATVTVTPTVGVPAAPTPATSTICQGSPNTTYTTTGATNATSYNWTVTGSGNTIAGTGTTGTVTWAAGFSGTATVSVTANGCNGPSSSASATVTVNPTPNVSNFTTTATTPICSGGVSTVTIGSTTLGNGTYTATYDLSAPNAATGLTASFTISSNSGTFSTPVLSNIGTTTVTITSVANATSCSSTPSSGNTAGVVVNAGPVVTISGAADVCVGGQITLTAGVSGGGGSITDLTWQRRVNAGSWGSVQSGTGTSYLTDNTLVTGSYDYEVILTQSGANCSATSSPVSANVADQPHILSDPTGASICKGGTVVLSAPAAGGTPSTLYQWEYAGSGIVTNNNPTGVTYSGETGNTLTISTDNTTTPPGITSYWLTVYATGIGCNAVDVVTSTTADVIITADPVVSNPAPATQPVICSGGTPATISVTASGGTGTILYQWYSNTSPSNTGGTLINGANSAGYDPPATPGTTYYYCVVSQAASGCGPVTTALTAEVTVGGAVTATVVEDECMSAAAANKYYVLVYGSGGTAPYTYWDGNNNPQFYMVTTTTPNEGVFEVDASSNPNTFTVKDANNCMATSTPVNVPAGAPVSIVLTNGTVSATSTVDCYVGAWDKWVTFREAPPLVNNALIAINPGTSNLGLVTVTTYKEDAAPVIWSNQSTWNCTWTQHTAMRRHFKVTTDNAPNSNGVGVRLFFTEQEFQDLKSDAWNNNIAYPNAGYACTQLDDVYSFSGQNPLFVTKYTDPNPGHATENGNYLDNLPSGIYKVYSQNTVTQHLTPGQYTGAGTGFQDPQLGYTNGDPDIHYVELNVSEFSEFWLHGSQQSEALPVEMIYLQADAVNNAYIQVSWATATEINNAGFAVERSMDGQTWSQIGWVDGHNNATSQNNYSYNDMNVVPDVVYYYRLKQVDNDGAIQYTDIVSARLSGEVTFSVKDFVPNPTMDKTSLIITATKDQEIRVTFYDVIGQKMMESSHEISRGGNRIEFDLGKLAAGTYTAVVSSANEVYSKKVVLTK